ncbi:hypothetical protein GCM10009552_22710 [Rothia nasimurium]|uniref:Transmembrane protein n=1 Tax=Luteibacter anthropi TaxID=564369 RepID=A0A7X5UEM9_9GAMM|nr:hypothetical protein [Luteibacter anthropi]NII08852.1 hypothetical protein [Luteibacter anthropi]
MPYDRSWMGFGMTGALEAGGIALLVGIVVYLLVRLMFGKGGGWSAGREVSVAFVLTLLVAGGEDMWNLFYFNVVPIQSTTLLRLKLAAVHDPDAIGLRVFFELVGGLVGVCIGWAVFSGGFKRLVGHVKGP